MNSFKCYIVAQLLITTVKFFIVWLFWKVKMLMNNSTSSYPPVAIFAIAKHSQYISERPGILACTVLSSQWSDRKHKNKLFLTKYYNFFIYILYSWVFSLLHLNTLKAPMVHSSQTLWLTFLGYAFTFFLILSDLIWSVKEEHCQINEWEISYSLMC